MPKKKGLRHGFTTGSAAAAAAKAGVLALGGLEVPEVLEIPLPEGGRMAIPVRRVTLSGKTATAVVIKDAGDDPDVTNRAEIRAVVRPQPGAVDGGVLIRAGSGVGRVTRPGLPVPVGEGAINPAPRAQIKDAVMEGLQEAGKHGGIAVTIEVPEGERIARKTLNPRLGIRGGISILGTRGTVKPFSHEAYTETIRVCLDVARAVGGTTAAFATGGKSEKNLRGNRPDLSDEAFVQVADHVAFSFEEAAARGFEEILYACFFGKLVKVAQGHPQTHAGRSRIDFGILASWVRRAGLHSVRADEVASANTAREALERILADPEGSRFLGEVVARALGAARGYAGKGPRLGLYLFGFGGEVLAYRYEEGLAG